MSPGVTVGLPIRNGERYLDEVLGAVREQKVDREVELLIVDSGSTDRTIEIAESHGARVHRIPSHEFSHGGTRNLIMELARGDHVAFLTDDATPAHDGWLRALLDAFAAADAGSLEQRLLALAEGVVAGCFEPTDEPHRELCATCPGRPALCCWDESRTLASKGM